MGRKIPGRKHRGVRDPEKQQQTRLEKIKNLINTAPSSTDDQPMPKSLLTLMSLKDRAKNYFKKSKNTKQGSTNKHSIKFQPSKSGLNRDSNPVYVQGEFESDHSFLNRVDEAVEDVVKEQKFEQKFNVNIKRNPRTGDIEGVVRRSKDVVEKYADELKQKKRSKGKKNKTDAEKMSKREKQKEKLIKKRVLKQQESFQVKKEVVHEHVEFGEVAHAPPTLSLPRMKKRLEKTSRPGTKELLLKSLLPEGKTAQKRKKVEGKSIDKKGKRKDLPNALRRQLDKQQNEIIQAYRDLKKEKSKKLNS